MWKAAQETYPCNKSGYFQSGISLLEILIAITMLSFILVPLSVSLREASKSNSVAEEAGLSGYYGIAKLEELLAMDFSDIPLSSPSGTPVSSPVSDTVSIKGKTVNRSVYVELFDGDGDSIPDASLKKITVIVDTVTFTMLKTDYAYATF